MTTTTALPYAQRLAAFLEAHPAAAVSGITHTGTCRYCGASMVDRLNRARTDHGWQVATGAERMDHYAVLDHLRATDVAAYSAASAHRSLEGGWPWDHAHQPDPASIRVNG